MLKHFVELLPKQSEKAMKKKDAVKFPCAVNIPKPVSRSCNHHWLQERSDLFMLVAKLGHTNQIPLPQGQAPLSLKVHTCLLWATCASFTCSPLKLLRVQRWRIQDDILAPLPHFREDNHKTGKCCCNALIRTSGQAEKSSQVAFLNKQPYTKLLSRLPGYCTLLPQKISKNLYLWSSFFSLLFYSHLKLFHLSKYFTRV